MFIRQFCSTMWLRPEVRVHPLFSFTGSGSQTQKLSNYLQHTVAECIIMVASLVQAGTFNFSVHSSCWDANKGPDSLWLAEIMTQTTLIWLLREFLTRTSLWNSEFEMKAKAAPSWIMTTRLIVIHLQGSFTMLSTWEKTMKKSPIRQRATDWPSVQKNNCNVIRASM